MAVVTEPFTGSGDLSANWTHFAEGQAGGPVRRNDTVGCTIGQGGGNEYAWYSGTSFNAAQYAQIKIGANAGEIAVSVRNSGSSSATHDGYELWRLDGTTLELFRLDDGTFTSLGQRTVTQGAGNILRLEINGSTLKAKIDGVQAGADFTDATYSTGAPGFSVSEDADDVGDDWEGGDLVGGPTVNPTGLALALSLGTPVISASVNISPSGFALAFSLGTPNISTGASVAVNPLGLLAVFELGTFTAEINTNVIVTGTQLTLSLGTPVIVLSDQITTISPPGFGLSLSLGTPLVVVSKSLLVSGFNLVFSLGVPTVQKSDEAVTVTPIGLQMNFSLGFPIRIGSSTAKHFISSRRRREFRDI